MKVENFISNLRDFLLTLTIPSLYLLGLFLIIKGGKVTPQSNFFSIFLLFVCFTGFLLWALGYLHLGKNGAFSVIPKISSGIVRTGPYKFIRHPIYAGILLVFFSLSLLTASAPGFFYTSFILFPLNFFRARNEEKVLEKTYGQKFHQYRQQTLF